MKPLVVYIVGPTASGKSDVGFELARRTGGEIVNADSMQIYRGMDIGTAKPGATQRRAVPHHMLDVADPRESYSASVFKAEASACIEDIMRRGKLPIVVGGTGLYIRSLTMDYDFGCTGGGGRIRAKLEEELASYGASHMHERLAQVDPISARRLHVNDTRRVIRALEVYETTGKPMDARDGAGRRNEAWNHMLFGMRMPREMLYARINERAELMISAGLKREVEGLLEAGVPADAQSMQGIGYKQFVEVLSSKCGFSDVIIAETIKRATRHLAKRQITWFNKDDVRWLEMGGERAVEQAIISIMDAI